MRLVNSKRIEAIKKAIVDVSGKSMIELETSRKHTVTSWATLGMYLMTKEGETAESAAKHYGRKQGIVYRKIKEIEDKLDDYQPVIDKILERVE
jgi:hypothetical protein